MRREGMSDPKAAFVRDFLAALRSESKHVDDLDDGDPRKTEGTTVGALITQLVGFLSIEFPNEDVNRLMGQVWHLFGSKTVGVMLYAVETPTAAVIMSEDGKILSMVLFPSNWAEMVTTNPQNAMGALVFCGSQMVDGYNGKVSKDGTDTLKRARACEAEYLRTLRSMDHAWVPDAYQERVMAEYPEGIRSPSVTNLWYEPKPPPDSPPPGYSA